PVGYKTTTTKSKWNPDYQEYVDYQRIVQLYAKANGLKLPLVATKDKQLIIKTVAYFKNGTHPDPENINKGVRDALFYDESKLNKRGRKSTGKGNDKHTGGSFPPPKYDKSNPRVVVTVKDYVPKRKK